MRFLVLVVLAVAAFPARAQAADIIVKRDPGLTRAERAEVRRDAGVTLVDTLALPDTEVVRATDDTAGALAALKADPDVAYAELDRPVGALTNDTFFDLQWALENTGQSGGTPDADMDVPDAWQTSTGAGVTVAVVDTGVDASAGDLAGQLASNPGEKPGNRIDDDGNGLVDDAYGWDFVGRDNNPDDEDGHGTHVTGTIAALAGNGFGIAGVAPGAKVLPIRALDENGDGTDSTIAQAFDYAGRMGVRIVNASLGGKGSSKTLTEAMAKHPNTLYIVAAGNDHFDTDLNAYAPCTSPAPNVVCVGASTPADARADFSNYGATTVDLFAPGVMIYSLWPGSSPLPMGGTSMAAPHVAGEAALALAADPEATTGQLKAALIASADPVEALSTKSVAGGRANAATAVAVIGTTVDPTAMPTPTPIVAAPTIRVEPAPAETVKPAVTPVVLAPAAVRVLKLSSRSLRRGGRLRATFTVTRSTPVRVSVTRAGRAKTSAAWSVPAHAGANSLRLGRRVRGRTLTRGRYTLTVATGRSSRTATFTVR